MKKLTLLPIIVFALFLMGMESENPVMRSLAQELMKKVEEIKVLKIENTDLKKQIKDLVTGSLNERIALEPARFASERNNNTSLYLRNPDHLNKVWTYVQKWDSLLTPEARATAGEMNTQFFVFCWFFKESHYNPFTVSYNYKEDIFGNYITKTGERANKKERSRAVLYDDLILLSTDWWMAQINDVVWKETYVELPEELKKKDVRDPEVATAMIYIWINKRVRAGMPWCYLSDEAWTLMWRLKQIKS